MMRLHTSTLGPLGVAFRPLAGSDEAALGGGGLTAAYGLIERLLVRPSDGFLDAQTLPGVSVADFDRMLAACHAALYGHRLECRIACTSCDEPLEFDVTLEDLLTPATLDIAPVPDEASGWFVLPDGRRFRLPTIGEIVSGLPAEQVTAACSEGDWAPETLDQAMAAVGPVGSDVIETTCAECGAAQSARLDLASYLIRMLIRERSFLAREVHVIARTYGWSHGEIMGLAREDRRSFVRLIEADAAARARAGRRIA